MHNDRMKFPNAPLVLGETSDPANQNLGVEHRTSKTLSENANYFFAC